MATSAAPDPVDPQAALPVFLESLHCGAATIDRRGVLVHCNQRLLAMLGRDRTQMIRRPLVSLYADPFSRRRIEQLHQRFEEPDEGEFYLPTPRGDLPVIIAARPLLHDGQPPSLRILTFTDISAQRQAYETITGLSDTVLAQALSLKDREAELERRVRQRTAELAEANLDAIHMLAVACEARDHDTGAHVRRIERFTAIVAAELGLDPAEAERYGYSAVLHDVGKLHVADAVLNKPGPLDDAERRLMQEHTVVGESILSKRPFFALARQIARSHHENWDGSGYPDGLAGEAIPLAARIVRLVDVFDALTCRRVYKQAWPPQDAMAAISDGSGRAFDPRIVRAFDAAAAAGRLDGILDPSETQA